MKMNKIPPRKILLLVSLCSFLFSTLYVHSQESAKDILQKQKDKNNKELSDLKEKPVALEFVGSSVSTARIHGSTHELVCMYVRHAREWHRDYMAHLAKALQP
jgi:hypothetical protein